MKKIDWNKVLHDPQFHKWVYGVIAFIAIVIGWYFLTK